MGNLQSRSQSTARVALLGLALWMNAFANAGVPMAFTEEALARGVNYAVLQEDTFGSGLAFADLDNDGDPDLVLVGRTTAGLPPAVGLYENDGTGHFIDRAAGSGIPNEARASGVTAADYDGDGDLDLHISVWLRPNLLLRNDGGFHFTDVSAAAGIDDDGAGAGCAWGDFDGDGWLDLYVPNRTATNLPSGPPSTVPNRLYRNRGDGTFEELGGALGVTDGDARSFQACFFDYDADNDADLYLGNDKGASSGCAWTNHLWQNVGGTFNDVSAASGTDVCIDAMCITIGDIDRNGFLDIYCTNTPPGNPLLLNNGDGTFDDWSEPAGVGTYLVSWGSIFFDYDNDGYLDLYVCNYFSANRLYTYDGAWPMVDLAVDLNVASQADSFCVAAADIDNDGDLDFVLSNTPGPTLLFINNEGARRNWVKFRVVGRGANRFGVGTRVDLVAAGGLQIREVLAGSDYKTQSDLTLHYGLAQDTSVGEVTVTWPGGETRAINGFAINQTWTLYPTERLGDWDGDADVDEADFAALVGCFDDTGLGAITPGCEMMDFDGDGDVDSADLDGFAFRFSGPNGDCNGNGESDLLDIALGSSADSNGDAIPDECTCPADLDGSGQVDLTDLSVILSNYGAVGGMSREDGDLDGDGDVDLADLAQLLAEFGTICS